MFKVVLFTHDDTDGAGCAIVFIIMMMTQTNIAFKVIHCSNNNVNDKIQEAWDNGTIDETTNICFGDICPSPEMAIKLQTNCRETIRVWDHHKTSSYISDCIDGAKIVTEIEPGKPECGTSLMYRFFSKVPAWNPESYNVTLLEELVENTRSYDTYEWKKTDNLLAQRLNALCKILGVERFVKRYVERILCTGIDQVADFMKTNGIYSNLIEDKDNEYIDAYLENEQRVVDSVGLDDVRLVKIKGFNAAVRFSGGASINEVANQFLTKHPNIDLFIDLGISGGYYAFRCIRDDIDLGAIFAKPLGGGGHAKAAGCPIPKELQEEIFTLLLDRLGSN